MVMQSPRSKRWAATGVLCVNLAVMLGCSPLEPIMEPEVSDLQLTVDTLKTTVRDSQRTIVELRAELDARRQELADVQIARAQFEGRVREAERRLVEARQVIDLQREELAGSRSERERAARTGLLLQNQMKQLQKQLSRFSKQGNEARAGIAPASLSSMPRAFGMAEVLSEPTEHSDGQTGMTTLAMHVPTGWSPRQSKPAQVSVKAGDTLWSISQRHRLPVKRLMALNQLLDNHIQVGQTLWLSESSEFERGQSQ